MVTKVRVSGTVIGIEHLKYGDHLVECDTRTDAVVRYGDVLCYGETTCSASRMDDHGQDQSLVNGEVS
jgi:hypothetical protein